MVSVVDGKAVAARNKGNIKQGGLSLDDVKNKFSNLKFVFKLNE